MPRQKKGEQTKQPRRVRGEGTVVERGDGRFVARIPIGGGKRKEEYYDTKQEAERARRRMLNERDAGKLVTQRDQTFGEYLTYWLNAHRTTIRSTTYSMYYSYLNARVIPALGHVGLRKLTVEMFQTLYQEWEKEPLSPNTIRLIHGIINEALSDAVKWKKLVYNPVQDVKLPKATKADIYVLSEEEVERLLQCAKEMSLYPLFLMALFLGMRRGELLGLKWADIDFNEATLHIQRTLSYKKNPETGQCEFIVGPPKTASSKRVLHLPKDIVKVLADYREQQSKTQAAASHWEQRDLVFCTGHGSYLHPYRIGNVFDRLLQRAGLEHMKFHALRHNASLILRNLGIDPVVRKEMLGHSSLAMTDDIYGHSTPKMHKQAAEQMNQLFDSETE